MRFPEFYGEWELKKIRNISSKINSGKTPLGGETVYTDKGVLFIRSQNVNDNSLDLENSTFISEKINGAMQNSVVFPNDILLNITGASLGRSCVVPVDFEVGNVNQHVCIIRLAKNNNPRFLQPYFSSDKGQNNFKRLQTGSGREGLNFESIKNLKIFITTPSEQNKIAEFLSFIDKRIQTQKEIIGRYESLMNSLCQNLFSHRLRFKDKIENNFQKWKEIELKKCCTFYSGGTPKSTNKAYYSGKIPFIGSGNISDSYVESFITDEALKSSSAKLVEEGDLLYALYGTTSGEVAISKIQGAINQAVLCIRTNENKYFLFYFLKHHKEKIVQTYIQGGQGNLSAKIVKELKVNLPSKEEQKKIASLLSKIDSKIKVEKQLINSLTTQKQYFLQQLFI